VQCNDELQNPAGTSIISNLNQMALVIHDPQLKDDFNVTQDNEIYSRFWTSSFGSRSADTAGLADGLYWYKLYCTDMAGNLYTGTKSIRVDGDTSTYDPYPKNVIDNEDDKVRLSIRTENQARCKYKLGAVGTGDDVSGETWKNMDEDGTYSATDTDMRFIKDIDLTTDYPDLSSWNTTYVFDVNCTITIGGSTRDSLDQISFTFDQVPPTVNIYDTENKEEPTDIDSWRGDQDIFLECLDSPRHGFGCASVDYCTVRGEGQTCDTAANQGTVENDDLAIFGSSKGIDLPPYPHTFCYRATENTTTNGDPANTATPPTTSLRYGNDHVFGGLSEEKCVYIKVDADRPELFITNLTPDSQSVYATDKIPYTVEGKLIDWSYYMKSGEELQTNNENPDYLEEWTFADFLMRGTITNNANRRNALDILFKDIPSGNKYVARIDQRDNTLKIYKNDLTQPQNILAELDGRDINKDTYDFELKAETKDGVTVFIFDVFDLGKITATIPEDNTFGRVGVRDALDNAELSNLLVLDPSIPVQNNIKWEIAGTNTKDEFDFTTQEIKSADGRTIDVTGTDEGIYTVNIRAYDKGGNMHFSPYSDPGSLREGDWEPYYFYLDTEPPTITSPLPGDGPKHIEYGADMTITAHIKESAANEPAAIVNVSQAILRTSKESVQMVFDDSGNPTDREEGDWTAELDPSIYGLGTYEYSIWTEDEFHHQTSMLYSPADDSGFVIEDNTAPVITLDDPAVESFNKWVSGTSVVTISGTYTELLPVEMNIIVIGEDPQTQYAKIPVSLSGGGSDIPFSQSINLFEGENTIYVEMLDQGEQLRGDDPTESSRLTIYYDTKPPELKGDKPDIQGENAGGGRGTDDHKKFEYGYNITIDATFDDPQWTNIVTEIGYSIRQASPRSATPSPISSTRTTPCITFWNPKKTRPCPTPMTNRSATTPFD